MALCSDHSWAHCSAQTSTREGTCSPLAITVIHVAAAWLRPGRPSRCDFQGEIRAGGRLGWAAQGAGCPRSRREPSTQQHLHRENPHKALSPCTAPCGCQAPTRGCEEEDLRGRHRAICQASENFRKLLKVPSCVAQWPGEHAAGS